MKYIRLFIVAILGINSLSVYATYEPPTREEQDLYNTLLEQFKKLDVSKKDVTDVITTFQKPLIITFPCNSNDTNNQVVAVVKTRLAKFDQNMVHQDLVTGGTYTWQCVVTTQQGKITIDCNNEIRLNPNIISNGTGIDPNVHQVENLIILYHELLHGQLMIDAIKSSPVWRQEVCNKPPDESIDYSFADTDHKIINPLQTQFASELIEKEGGKMITKEVKPKETQNGEFTIKVISLTDYPQFERGVKITLRGSNINNTSFSSGSNDVYLAGNLVNKTKSGMAWFYLFSKQQQTTTNISIPAWTKRIAGLWSAGNVSDNDFYGIISYLIEQNIIVTNSNEHSGIIPHWFKKNAQWWYGGEIDDQTFVNSAQYLISGKIIS